MYKTNRDGEKIVMKLTVLMCYFPQNIFIDVVMISAAYVHGKTFFMNNIDFFFQIDAYVLKKLFS